MDLLLLLPILVGFLVTFLILPKWIKKAKKVGLVWEDMNKYGKPKDVTGSGGLIVIMGFVVSVMIYIALKTFYFQNDSTIVKIFSLATTMLILAGIGIVDDLLGWHHGGLSKKFRLILCVFAAIPLMVINAGRSDIALPLIGNVDLGLLYPLLMIPIGIVGAATTFNFLAGFNGLEASQGILILTALSIVSYFTDNSWLALIGMSMVLCLIAFWIFNKVPAKVFPGDVLTYPVGGLIAIMAILGNMEKIAVFFFIPYILEVILKTRGKLVKQSFGKPNKDSSLKLPYDKIYGLGHLSIFILKKFKNKVYEADVVNFINLIQIVFIIAGFLLFRNFIF